MLDCKLYSGKNKHLNFTIKSSFFKNDYYLQSEGSISVLEPVEYIKEA